MQLPTHGRVVVYFDTHSALGVGLATTRHANPSAASNHLQAADLSCKPVDTRVRVYRGACSRARQSLVRLPKLMHHSPDGISGRLSWFLLIVCGSTSYTNYHTTSCLFSSYLTRSPCLCLPPPTRPCLQQPWPQQLAPVTTHEAMRLRTHPMHTCAFLLRPGCRGTSSATFSYNTRPVSSPLCASPLSELTTPRTVGDVGVDQGSISVFQRHTHASHDPPFSWVAFTLSRGCVRGI